MTVLLVSVHVIACILLIILVLVQRGRGGGLVESFAGVESMFGTKTSAFLTRTTTVCAVLFFLTCLSLALLSARKSKSLMSDVKPVSSKVMQEPVVAESLPASLQETQAPEGAAK